MLVGYSPLFQTFLGTLFSWGLTALGAGFAFVAVGNHNKCLDGSLGFAGGVMIAASYWSLLEPAIEMAESFQYYGDYAFLPVACGFFFGALFVYVADIIVSKTQAAFHKLDKKVETPNTLVTESETSSLDNLLIYGCETSNLRRRKEDKLMEEELGESPSALMIQSLSQEASWKRILLLIIAITVHNIPEGMAIGAAFGSVGRSPSATFENARNLAIGIGIQNLPEGLAVSLPLKLAGYSSAKSVWYGQLSGMVELFAGLIGVLMVSWIRPLLPYALAFAAGAMIYVVLDDIVPEANSRGNGKIASWSGIIGFLVMMSLDVGFS